MPRPLGHHRPVDAITVRPYAAATDERWAEGVADDGVGGRIQVRRGAAVDVLALPGLVAEAGGERVGLLTYGPGRDEVELALLIATERRRGVGTALLRALEAAAEGCARIWVSTTNDNLDALRFYQRRGFTLHVLRPAVVDDARRRLKPAIPEVGGYGIPIRDEVELELHLR